MATRGVYRCRNCGHEFEATVGPLLTAEEYRCDRCGRVEYVKMPTLMEVMEAFPDKAPKPKAPGRCICGGEFKKGLSPKCRACGSWDTECIRTTAFLD